jgi:hypothetical protein
MNAGVNPDVSNTSIRNQDKIESILVFDNQHP